MKNIKFLVLGFVIFVSHITFGQARSTQFRQNQGSKKEQYHQNQNHRHAQVEYQNQGHHRDLQFAHHRNMQNQRGYQSSCYHRGHHGRYLRLRYHRHTRRGCCHRRRYCR